MADTADLDYVHLVQRLGATVGDTPDDVDSDPDFVPVTEGTITIVPTLPEAKVMVNGAPVSVMNAPIVCTVDPQGYLSYGGTRGVWIVDLGSSKVTPPVPRDKAAYTITYSGLKFGTQSFKKAQVSINPDSVELAGADFNLTEATSLPLPSGVTMAYIQNLADQAVAARDDLLAQKGEPGGIAALSTDGAVLDAYGAALARKAGAVRQVPLSLFRSDFQTNPDGSLRDWTTAHTGTCSHSVAASTRANGGNTVTLLDTDTAGIALIRTASNFTGYGDSPQWYTTDEMTLTNNCGIQWELRQGTSRRARLQVRPDSVSIEANDGLGLVAAPNIGTATGFDGTKPFRLGIWYDPSTGRTRFYIYYGATPVKHAFLGERTVTAIPLPINSVALNTEQARTGNATAARMEAHEVRGVIMGCSTDMPNMAFDTSPEKLPTQDRNFDSAKALALRLWGVPWGIVNQGHGGWTAVNFRDGGQAVDGEDTATFANMVTELNPGWVLLGSGINSVAAAAALLPDQTAANALMETHKTAYTDCIDQALAVCEFVVVRNCSPVGGHVSFPTSAALDMVDAWNAWIAGLPGIYSGKVAVVDVFGRMVDPANPRHLLPAYDVGDHIHYSTAGAEALASADAAAVLSY